MTVTSKFNRFRTIIAPISLVVWLAAIACLIAFLSLQEVNTGNVDSIFKTPIYATVVLIGIIIGSVYHYLKMCQTIQIDTSGLKINSIFKAVFIPWKEIFEIDLIAKDHATMSLADATIIKLKNGKQLAIVGIYYENMANIRRALAQAMKHINCKEPVVIDRMEELVKIDLVDLKKMTKYSGPHFLSFNGLVLYSWIALSFSLLMKMPLDSLISVLAMVLILLGISGFLYGFLGLQLHYFYVDNNYLVIKNHFWPWKSHVYAIDNIKQVVFETPYKRSASLRVITNNYNSNLYPGESLRSSTWKNLLQKLKHLNVDIKNETVF